MKPFLAALLVLLPLDASAQDVTEADVERYIAVIVANGCTMTEDEAMALLPKAGFTQAMSVEISELLVDDGRALAEDERDRLTLSPEVCG